jgi:hypothetical protein
VPNERGGRTMNDTCGSDINFGTTHALARAISL